LNPDTVWLNDGKGRFTDCGLRLGNANSVAAAVGDLNGDGKPDVFVANVRNIVTKEGAGFNEVWLNTTVFGGGGKNVLTGGYCFKLELALSAKGN